jgi:hypothetical protein
MNSFEELMTEPRKLQKKKRAEKHLWKLIKFCGLSCDTKATDLDHSSTVEVTVPADIPDKGISPTLVVEAYNCLTEATLPLMADTLATKSVLHTSVQSWWIQRSIP